MKICRAFLESPHRACRNVGPLGDLLPQRPRWRGEPLGSARALTPPPVPSWTPHPVAARDRGGIGEGADSSTRGARAQPKLDCIVPAHGVIHQKIFRKYNKAHRQPVHPPSYIP